MAVALQEKIDVLQVYVEHLYEYTGRKIILSASDLNTLAEMMMVRNYSKKFKLVAAGDKEEFLHFVSKGLARKYFMKGKDEVIVQLAREGDMISSVVSFFIGEKSLYTVEAIEPIVVFSLPKAKMDQLLRFSNGVNKLARVILTEHILQQESYEINQLKYNIRERFQQFVENNPDLFLRVPHKYQASYLNIKPETFSRLKAQVANKVKAISTEK